jgi:hypothetical protein
MLDLGLWNQNHEQVGEEEDFVLDLGNTRISCLVTETGSFLDIGERTNLVP